MKKSLLKLFVTIFLSLTVVLILFSCQKDDAAIEIVLAESSLSNQVALTHIAREKGFWKEKGLSVRVSSFSSGRQAFDAVLGGSAQFATVAQTPIAMAGFSRADFKVIAEIANVSNELSFVANKKSGIQEFSDIKGKRVAYSAGTQADFFLTLALESNGLSREDIVEVSMSPPDTVSAIANGTVDVAVAWRPHSLNSIEVLGDNAVILPTEGLYTAIMTIVSGTEYLRANPDVAKKFLAGLIKAENYIVENRADSIALVSKNVKLPTDKLNDIFDDYLFKVKLSDVLLNSLNEQGKWAIDANIKKHPILPDYNQIVERSILQAIKPGK